MAESPIVIDGSYLEGGGQILRNAAALSCLLGLPVKINNIRAGRSNPGLRPQHLTGLQLIRDICGGRLDGGQVGSTEVTLYPSRIRAGTHRADTKTAGSICLLLQASLPCLLYANGPSCLNLLGGTNAEMAPQIDYLTWVFQPIAEKFGLRFNCDIIRRGYYPKGGGEVIVQADPLKNLKAVNLTEVGEVTSITGRAFVAGVLPPKVAHMMARAAQDMLKSHYRNVSVKIEGMKEPQDKAFGTGTGIIVMAETSTGCRLAGSAIGRRGVPADEVGRTAAEMLLHNLNHRGCVDDHLQDQLIILMALAQGHSKVTCGPLTQHTQTAIHVAQSITSAKFEIKQLDGDLHLIQCDGIGHVNKQYAGS